MLILPGKVFTKSKRKTGGGPVAKLSSLMSSVVEEMTSSPTSSQSSVTSIDDVVAPGDDDADTTDYVFRIVYMTRPDYVGEFSGSCELYSRSVAHAQILLNGTVLVCSMCARCGEAARLHLHGGCQTSPTQAVGLSNLVAREAMAKKS